MCSHPHLQPDLNCKLDPRKKACHLSEESWQELYPGSDFSCVDLKLWVFIQMANNATFCRAPAQHSPFCISITMTEPFVGQQCQCRAPRDISVLCTSCHSSHAAVLQRTRNKCMHSVNGNIGWIRVANPTSLHCNLEEVLQSAANSGRHFLWSRSHGNNPQARQINNRLLESLWESWSLFNGPMILAGDFNMALSAEPIGSKLQRAGWTDCAQHFAIRKGSEAPKTYKCQTRIDQIWANHSALTFVSGPLWTPRMGTRLWSVADCTNPCNGLAK